MASLFCMANYVGTLPTDLCFPSQVVSSSNIRAGTMLRTAFGHRIRALNVKHRCFSSSSSSSPAAAAVKIDDEEVKKFEEDGAIVVRKLFSPDWVEQLRDVVEVNMKNPGPLCDEHVKPGEPGRFHDDQFLWMRYDVANKFLFESPAGEIAKRMTRAKQVRLFYDQLFIKEPGTRTTTPWHNDHSYWPLIGDQVISLWLALDYVPKSSCVQYVKGSHKWKLMHKIRSFAGNEGRYQDANLDSLPDMPDIDNQLDKVELLTWDMEPGDCLVHHSFSVHGSPGISESGHRRRAYATRWVGDQVIFDPRPGTMYQLWLKAGYDAKLGPGSTMESELFPAVA
ncbi:unnamed protein product [Calypogeia fissa]